MVLVLFSLILRRGGGRNRSSSEKVRAAEPPGGFGLLRLKIDGFLIPNLLNIERCEPGGAMLAATAG